MTEPDPIIDFLKKDYELKINYLTAHLTRMWQRFNFFIALESALSVALFGLFKEKEEVLSQYATPIALIGIGSSICWYILGAQDRYLVALYREHVEDTGKKIADQLGLIGYVYVVILNPGGSGMSLFSSGEVIISALRDLRLSSRCW